MKFFMKLTATLVLMLAGLSALAYFFWYKPKFNVDAGKKAFEVKREVSRKNALLKLKQRSSRIASFAKQNNYNSTHSFLIDMSLPSGKQRFFVYNLKKDSVECAGLVTHGSGSVTGKEELYFSNLPGSSCTSLGKYKIGHSYQGKFGLAYKLYGLDKTNNKAFERFVVLHAHSCVPAAEVYPLPICPSLGCPTVSPEFLKKLAGYIDVSGKPILLEIYN
jgi:L,D-transpeptidase catalytic domain